MNTRDLAAVPIESTPRRRPWTTPQLVVHDSMMVLTQHFFGAPSASLMLWQVGFSCVVGSTDPNCT
jgi:hypothetical protein